jgi:hypothetical protein
MRALSFSRSAWPRLSVNSPVTENEAVIAAGKHVYCEKPVAVDVPTMNMKEGMISSQKTNPFTRSWMILGAEPRTLDDLSGPDLPPTAQDRCHNEVVRRTPQAVQRPFATTCKRGRIADHPDNRRARSSAISSPTRDCGVTPTFNHAPQWLATTTMLPPPATLLRWPRTGLQRSGFKVLHEISTAHDFAGSTASCQFQRCPPQNRSADRTDELSNSPDRTKSRNPHQSGTSSDSCSEPKYEGSVAPIFRDNARKSFAVHIFTMDGTRCSGAGPILVRLLMRSTRYKAPPGASVVCLTILRSGSPGLTPGVLALA